MRELTNVVGGVMLLRHERPQSWGLVRLELVFGTLDNTFIYLHLGQTAGVT